MTDPVTTPPPTRQGLTERLAAVLAEHADCTLNDTRGSIDIAAAVTGQDVWSCGIVLPFAGELDEAEHLHRAAALVPLVTAEVAAAKADALREAASELAAATEGPLRVGTRLWPECDRDAYSLAIEEARSALRARADRLAATTDGGQS